MDYGVSGGFQQPSACLSPADPTLPFILDTDTTGVGVEGMLSHVGSEGGRVLASFSRGFNKAERR